MTPDHFIIIAYYYGTKTLTGSRRWREMSQLLQEHGRVSVICADGGDRGCGGIEIVHLPDRRMRNPAKVFSAPARTPFLSWVSRVASSFLFWPDRQKLWSRQAVGHLDRLLDAESRNIVITSGPVFSVHSEMRRWLEGNPGRVIWVMDFRDLWTNEIAPGLQRRTPAVLNRIERKIEQRCHDSADLVMAVGKGLARLLRNDFGSLPVVLYNGYLEKKAPEEVVASKPISVRYLGTIIPGLRSPALLFQAAADLKLTPEDLRFDFWCNDHPRVLQEAEAAGVASLLKCHDAVSEEEARHLGRTAGANMILNALVPEADQVVTGKVFELIAAGRPILPVTGKGSELRKILEKCGSMHCVWNLETARTSLRMLLEGSLPELVDAEGVFSRQQAVDTFLSVLHGREPGPNCSMS